MKKACIKFAMVFIAVMIILSGCINPQAWSVPINHKDYEPKKTACCQIIKDNEDHLDNIVQKLEAYDYNMSFWYEDGEVKVGGDAPQAEIELLIHDDEALMNELQAVLQNEYIDVMTKTIFEYQTEYSYTVYFTKIAKGHICYAYLDKDSENAARYGEHIAGDWYYFIGQFE